MPIHNASEIEMGIAASFAREPNGGLIVMPDAFAATSGLIIACRAPSAAGGLPDRHFAASGGLCPMQRVADVFGGQPVRRLYPQRHEPRRAVQAPSKYELSSILKARRRPASCAAHLLARADLADRMKAERMIGGMGATNARRWSDGERESCHHELTAEAGARRAGGYFANMSGCSWQSFASPCSPMGCQNSGSLIRNTRRLSFAFSANRRKRQPRRSDSSSRRSRVRLAGLRSCRGRPERLTSVGLTGCACCARYPPSPSCRSSTPAGASSSASRVSPWTWLAVRAISPRNLNSSKQWPARSITDRSISGASRSLT